MGVFLFDVFKHLLLKKNNHFQNLSEMYISRKENFQKCTSLEEREGIFRKTFIIINALLSSVVFRLQNGVSDFY